MGKIKVFKAGLLTLVQDQGRNGYQQYGVPVSGVMDNFAYRIANILVGNHEEAAVIEATLVGPGIEFLDEGVIAITGGNLSPEVNGKPIPMGKSVFVKSGDRLDFKAIKAGCRSYIAFAGGIDVPAIMGSKSTYTRGNIGGYEGRGLKVGDVITLASPHKPLKELVGKWIQQELYSYTNTVEVRVVAGPQEDAFTQEGIATFYNTEYTVTNECDRMGYRLSGKGIQHKEGSDIISDGIAMGAIQVPGHGMPIIMMADRQTTGGYTKIANVITVDFPKIAQAKPGDKIIFKKVAVEEAHSLLKEVEEKIAQYKRQSIGREVIKTREFHLKINGKAYDVMVDEIKS
ncbi:5-oxoprolinase subunit C family protein [Natronincola ferrireducens]|uniref:5-oxoprolinase subunit C family protein n=1 Tax=Natronincola ferrireducens TaxID=393762 RepID=UPI000A73DFB0|nr:biotin-dependent carboxyltransferase family protein [Natronincola ferrireducens]